MLFVKLTVSFLYTIADLNSQTFQHFEFNTEINKKWSSLSYFGPSSEELKAGCSVLQCWL